MRTLVKYLKIGLCGLCPVNRICDYPSYVRIIEGSAGLMTGLEVEHSARAALKASTASEHVSVLKPTDEEKIVGLRNKEGLGIKLLRKVCLSGLANCTHRHTRPWMTKKTDERR